jgi:hypothetical protein
VTTEWFGGPKSGIANHIGLLWTQSSASSAGNGATFSGTARKKRPCAHDVELEPMARAGRLEKPCALPTMATLQGAQPAEVPTLPGLGPAHRGPRRERKPKKPTHTGQEPSKLQPSQQAQPFFTFVASQATQAAQEDDGFQEVARKGKRGRPTLHRGSWPRSSPGSTSCDAL